MQHSAPPTTCTTCYTNMVRVQTDLSGVNAHKNMCICIDTHMSTFQDVVQDSIQDTYNGDKKDGRTGWVTSSGPMTAATLSSTLKDNTL